MEPNDIENRRTIAPLNRIDAVLLQLMTKHLQFKHQSQ